MDYSSDMQDNDTLASDPAMIRIYEKADLLAQRDASILIYGESGVGKNHLAEYIQKKGAAPHAPFIHVYCNAVSDQLFASELFGYTANAFTGASAKGKTGLLESAQNGTILFDEINELSPENQALLLHFLQNRTITPIGALTSREIHTRIIATSGRNLLDMIQEGSFRADLYYRLCVARIFIPPLRERREEIPMFIRHFIRLYEKEHGGGPHPISRSQMVKLCCLKWSGNLWEIKNLALRICLADSTDDVIRHYLEQEQTCALSSPPPALPQIHDAEDPERTVKPLKEAMQEFEHTYIENVIRQSPNLRSAAEQLGISYSSLCRKPAEYRAQAPDNEQP